MGSPLPFSEKWKKTAGLSLMCRRWNGYRNILIPRNLRCPVKILIAHLCIVFTPDKQKGVVLLYKTNEQIHIMTLSYYSNKSIFFKADCVRSKHEKHSQDSRENCQVQNTIALIWQLLSSILNTKFWNMLEHHGFSFAWKIKSMVFLTTFSSSCH